MKNRKQKMSEYLQKYSDIPKDYNERLDYLLSLYNLSDNRMIELVDKKRVMESTMQYNSFNVVLYEDPEGAKRPRFRIVNRKNLSNVAKANSDFIHVYSPNAAEDNAYMHRLIGSELDYLDWFIQTPCQVTINTYSKTPSYFNQVDTILAEIGLHRPIPKPDWDNIGKKYSDMFNANVWLDDQLVTDGSVHKYYSILPRVEIYIRYLNCVTNIYNYNQITNRKDYNNNYPIQYLDKGGFLV